MKPLFKKLFPCFFPKEKTEQKIVFPNWNYEQKNFDLDFGFDLNNYRKSQGKSLFKISFEQDEVDMVYDHVKYMVEKSKPSHDYFDKRVDYMRQKYSESTKCGECTAYNFSSASSYLNAFLNSEKHRQIIDNPEFDTVIICSSNQEIPKYISVFFYKK